MSTFIQDEYTHGYAQKAFEKGVKEGTLNLSLYLDKFVNLKALLNSPNTAKRLALGLISEPDKFKNFSSLIKKDKNKADKLVEHAPYHVPSTPLKMAIEEHNIYLKLHEQLLNSVRARKFEMRAASRLVVGLGDESVYETGIRLHKSYGVPYIPASALKGVTSHWAVLKMADKLSNGEKELSEIVKRAHEALQNPKKEGVSEKIATCEIAIEGSSTSVSFDDLRKIFGTQSQKGKIVFFDAYPNLEDTVLELDIMNPHYVPYYQGKKEVGDWYSPTPIFFLAVPRGVQFRFALASWGYDDELLVKAEDLLKEALREHGAGAKTSLGYGRFE